MKKFMRPCAIFLSVVMFLNMMDLGVFAETVQKVMDESNNPYYIADEDKIYDEELSSNSACIVMELEDKRDENTKQFLLSDHSVQAVIYAQPVHYLENGELQIFLSLFFVIIIVTVIPYSSSSASSSCFSTSWLLMRGMSSTEGETPNASASVQSRACFGVLTPDSYCAMRMSAVSGGKPAAMPSAFCVIPRSIR